MIFHQKINFAELPEFQEGLFEIQDEASQLISMLVEATPKQQVLDYCAGSGGKTLAFAPLLKNSGQIYLHDIRPQILLKAKKRLCRAGIQNVQFCLPKHKKSMDWVLVDAPCTGSGTLRRNPDMKWKFDSSLLNRLVAEQRQIFEQALEYLKPSGKIVYATCSLFPQENQDQIQYFQEKFGLKLAKEVFQSFPEKNGMDGFFAAVLTYQ
jgi:16S rRNA C967 or C1407 C5-methylase (RsmB/RsmF family)